MLNSINCSTVIRLPTVILMLLREATSETYSILIFQQQAISITIYFAFFTFTLYHKNTKNIILSYLSDLTLVSDHEGIDNPFIALVARFLFFCVGAWDSSVVSYWIDTLVLKTEGNTYATLMHHPFLFKGKPTHAQEVARRISGAVDGEIYAKLRHTKYPS